MVSIPVENLFETKLKLRRINLCESLFCISIISIFFPIKIYPVFFAISSVLFFSQNLSFKRAKWMLFLCTYIFYTILIFVAKSSHNTFVTSNIVKLIINFIFLISSITWMGRRDNTNLVYWVDKSFTLIFFLTFLQILLYHADTGFTFLTNVESSAQASLLYNNSLYFWGVFDKNMFGAKIALLGYIYLISQIVIKNKLSFSRVSFVFILSYMSLSRTPIGVIIIGLIYILFKKSSFFQKGVLISLFLMVLPFILNKFLRINEFDQMSDGMGIRIIYWTTFFTNLNHISLFGNGFLSGEAFLERYSVFYNGEPNLHNTFLNTYLDIGAVGLISYVFFLYFLMKYVIKISDNKTLIVACFLPLLANMMILFTGYDNDVIVYLCITFLLCTYRAVNFKTLKWNF